MSAAIPNYPIVRFIMRAGTAIALALSSIPLLAAIVAVALGSSLWWILLGAAVTPVVYLFVQSYVELVRIIGDTLLPR